MASPASLVVTFPLMSGVRSSDLASTDAIASSQCNLGIRMPASSAEGGVFHGTLKTSTSAFAFLCRGTTTKYWFSSGTSRAVLTRITGEESLSRRRRKM